MGPKPQMPTFFNRIVSECIGVLTAATLGTSAITAFAIFDVIGPNWMTNLASQGVPFYLVALVMAGIAFLAFGRWRRGVASLLLAAIFTTLFYQNVSRGFAPAPEVSTNATKLKVIHFNILYNNQKSKELAEYFLKEDADVVVILEAPAIARYQGILFQKYPHQTACGGAKPCDIIILSKYQPTNVITRTGGTIWRNRFVKVEYEKEGKPFTVVATHFTKPHYDWTQMSEYYNYTRNLARMDGPLILTGDFNATPWGNGFQRFLEQNRFKLQQWPKGTWPVEWGDYAVPIDHVMARDGAVISNVELVPEILGSNHRGLIAEVTLSGE